MSRRLTLEQAVAKLIADHSLAAVKHCIDMADAVLNPRVAKKPVVKKTTKTVVVPSERPA